MRMDESTWGESEERGGVCVGNQEKNQYFKKEEVINLTTVESRKRRKSTVNWLVIDQDFGNR